MAGRAVLMMTMLVGMLLLAVARPAGAAAQDAGAIDAEALEDFFDTAVPQSLEQHHVPGATVSVVHDGEVVFTGGYGMADVEGDRAFDPETSMVRVASISKLFTWTAVMQLVEAGQLDLDEDVNTYLESFKIPETFPEPITLKDLMSHTAGFEFRGIGIAAREKDDVVPLGAHLKDHLPERVRPPGEMSAYSNHGAAVAGLIVSEVTGEPYEQYIDDHILQPLEMTHSTAWEPVPEPLADDQARSYEYRVTASDSKPAGGEVSDGAYEPVPFIYDELVPDGSVSASAVDMAHFMIAHLRNGRFADTRILERETAQLMHEQSFTAAPAVSGWAHGFKERTFNGRRAIMHDGSWEQFQSAMVLIPDEDLGVFVSYNGAGGIEAGGELLPAFFDLVLPAPEQEPPPAVQADASVEERIPGLYRATRSSHTTIEKVLTLVESSRASIADDGTLRFTGREWYPVEPSVYQEVDGTDRLAFVVSEDGATEYLATDGPAYEKLAWYETIQFNLVVLLVFIVPALTVVIGWPVMALVRRLRKRPAPVRPQPWRRARRLAAAGSVVGLFFVVMLVITLMGDTSDFIYGVPLGFRLLILVPLVFVALVIAAVATTVQAFRAEAEPVGRLAGVHQIIAILGMVSMFWFLSQWNLIGWHFG